MTEVKGRINVYICRNRCGNEIITRNRDEGVTPFMVRCDRCSPTIHDKFVAMESSFYRVDQTLTPTHEWIKPTKEELKKIYAVKRPDKNSKRAVKEHLDQGGLMLMKIGEIE